MNTIDTSSEVNTTDVVRRAFALSRRARDLLLFSLLCGGGGEVSDERGAAKRWRELTGGAWNATRGGEAVVELAEAGFEVSPFLLSFFGAVQAEKFKRILKTTGAFDRAAARVTYNESTGVTSRARDVLGQRPSSQNTPRRRSFDGEAHLLRKYRQGARRPRSPRLLRKRRELRRIIDLRKNPKKQKYSGAQAGAAQRQVSASDLARASVASRGIANNLPGQIQEQSESLTEVKELGATGGNKTTNEPLTEVKAAYRSESEKLTEVKAPEADSTLDQCQTGGTKKKKPSKNLLAAIAQQGKVVNVAEVARAVDRVYQGEHGVTVPGVNDEPTQEQVEATRGQQEFPEFEAESEEGGATAIKPNATELASKLVVFWGARSGRPRVRVTQGRIDMVKARLREGYTRDDLHRAIAGVCYSPFHRDNGHDTIEVAIRRGEQVEKGIRLWFLYAPAQLIAEHEDRYGEIVPDRAEDVAKYRRRQASMARAAEREKAQAEGRPVEQPTKKPDIEEIMRRAATRMVAKDEIKDLKRKIAAIKRAVPFLERNNATEYLEENERDRVAHEKRIQELTQEFDFEEKDLEI